VCVGLCFCGLVVGGDGHGWLVMSPVVMVMVGGFWYGSETGLITVGFL